MLSRTCTLFALVLAASFQLTLAACTKSNSSASSGAGSSSSGEPDPCDCAPCKAEGGVCTDGCIDGGGCHSVECYHPSPPGPGQFSCDDLVNCYIGWVCLYETGAPDGCYRHYCALPPPECPNDPSCACIEQYAVGAWECVENGEGSMLVFGNGGDPPW